MNHPCRASTLSAPAFVLFAMLFAGCGGGGGSGATAPNISTDLRGKSDVDLSAPLTVTFDTDMDEATLTSLSVQLLRDGNPLIAQVIAATRSAELRPAGSLEPLTTYEILVTTAAKTLDGRSAGSDQRFPFTTRALGASDAPRLVASVPGAGAEVTPTATFILDFDRPLAPASVGPAAIFVRPTGGTTLGSAHQLLNDGRRVVVTTPQPLPAGGHELVITPTLRSTEGIPFAREAILPFRVLDGFFVVRTEPAAGSRVGLGLGQLTVEFNREVRFRAGSIIRLSQGTTPISLQYRIEGTGLTLTPAPLQQEGDYTLVLENLADADGNALTTPFEATFTVDAREMGWTIPAEFAIQGLLMDNSIGNVAFATSQNGRAALLWTERDRGGPQRNAFAADFDGTNWSQPFLLEDSLNDASQPQVAINDNGDIVGGWSEFVGGNQSARARMRRSGQWGAVQTLSGMEIVSAVHVAPNGDAGAVGTTWRENNVSVVASIGGNFQSAYQVLAGTNIAVAPTEIARWQDDDAGRRLVLISGYVANSYGLFATRFEPGQGWSSPTRVFTGNGQPSPTHEHVTPTGDAVLLFAGAAGTNYGRFAQCMRNGTWLGTAQYLDGASAQHGQAFALTGRSGDTITVATLADQGRTRAHARILRLSTGAFDAGRFIDDTDVTSTTGLRLLGSPDSRATVIFDRNRQTGSYTAKCEWDAAASTFLPLERAGVTPPLASMAHDRDGNAVALTHTGAVRYVPGVGLTAERRNPFTNHRVIGTAVSRHGRIYSIAIRTERRSNETFEFLRVNYFR